MVEKSRLHNGGRVDEVVNMRGKDVVKRWDGGAGHKNESKT